jgi:hypothetical protein
VLRPSREIWRPVRTKGLTLSREVYELGGEEGGMFMMVAWYMYIYPTKRAGVSNHRKPGVFRGQRSG